MEPVDEDHVQDDLRLWPGEVFVPGGLHEPRAAQPQRMAEPAPEADARDRVDPDLELRAHVEQHHPDVHADLEVARTREAVELPLDYPCARRQGVAETHPGAADVRRPSSAHLGDSAHLARIDAVQEALDGLAIECAGPK